MLLKYIFLFLWFVSALFSNSNIIVNKMYFSDTNNTHTIKSIYNNKNIFQKLDANHESLGFHNYTVWIYFKLYNTGEETISNLFYFPYPLHDYLHIYKFKKSKKFEEYITGDRTKFNTRKIIDNKFVIPYKLASHESMEIIVKINSQSALNIGTKFLSQMEYYSESKSSELLLGIYYGAIIIMLLYNLILYFVIKARVYLDYVLFHLLNLFMQLGLNGLAFEYLYPSHPLANAYFIPITFALTNYFAINFTFSFLNLKYYIPKVSFYFKILSFFSLSLTLLTFFTSYIFIIKLITILSMIIAFSLFAVALYILQKHRTSAAKFFVTAWSFLLVGVFIAESLNIGLVRMNFFTLYGAQIGTLIELALLSIALAYRYNSIYTKLAARESDLQILNNELETKVQNRTRILDEKNIQLNIEVRNKNILLRELYHRVKNNLQIISSLLSLQSKRIDDKRAKSIFNENIQRIKSIALIHEKLYNSNNLEIISMQEYIKELVVDLEKSFQGNNLSLEVSCEDINLNIEIAVPIGLIINELVTNSLKYAFNNSHTPPRIKIIMQTLNDFTLELEINDNGVGTDLDKLQEGFGFKLLNFLAVYQLKGKITSINNNGLHTKINFPKDLLL